MAIGAAGQDHRSSDGPVLEFPYQFYRFGYVCVACAQCVSACVSCVRACVCAWVRGCVRAGDAWVRERECMSKDVRTEHL